MIPTPSKAMSGLLIALLFAISARAQAPLKLVGQLSPFSGDNRYADIWGEGNYAYLGSYNGTGVMIIDISDPTAPRLVGNYNPSEGGRFQDLVVVNGIGYFSSESRGGVHIVDVRNPANPVLLSQVTEAKNGFVNVHELFVDNGVLYTCDSRTNRVRIFDVGNPSNPLFVREIITTDTRFIHAVTVVNGRLFTSGWSGKTDIYDIRRVLTEPPPLLGSVDSGTTSHAAWMSNDARIMVSCRETVDGDVRLFDISNPANPQPLATITAKSLGLDAFSSHNPYILGNMLFVSWYQAGVAVIDITDPRQPRLTGVYDTFPGSSTGFDGCWGVYPFLGFDRVLISDLDKGLFIVDATAALAGPRTVSAASYGFSAIASRSIAALFGVNLSTGTQAASATPLPTALGGTTISVLDVLGVERLAPLFFVSPSQINYQIPAGTAPGPALIKVTNGAGQVSRGATIVAASAPSIFTLDLSGRGPAAALDAFTFRPAPFPATQSNGQPNAIAVYATGLGSDATEVDGNVNASVQATIDGQPVQVSYAGRAPGFVGLNQINLVFPPAIASGPHQLVISRSGQASNAVIITIR
ncbi:MAG: choice-of-anchor B family protein [Blastocatellia bacterium]|nr:choice-of-anchor B family protein [Blastocatellia bacterium]